MGTMKMRNFEVLRHGSNQNGLASAKSGVPADFVARNPENDGPDEHGNPLLTGCGRFRAGDRCGVCLPHAAATNMDGLPERCANVLEKDANDHLER
jgi:hypothetical protein